tara:strand:+ start:7984 stop:8433 length:450 start_codon:yes stop_codon:yes gene_type:complete
MNDDNTSCLKLVGKNDEDLEIISAYLQDSIVFTKNILFLKKNRTFIMILNRFMWEDAEKGVFRKNKRTKCAVKFEEVISVKAKNIKQKEKDIPLEYLAIQSNLDSHNLFKIEIFFSGGGIITLTSEVIEVYMNDLGKPWNVKHFPTHQI